MGATLLLLPERVSEATPLSTAPETLRPGGDPRDFSATAALIDRLAHHATMITLKGNSYRPRERGLDVVPAILLTSPGPSGALFGLPKLAHLFGFA